MAEKSLSQKYNLQQWVQYSFVLLAFVTPWSRSGISITTSLFALFWFIQIALERNITEKFRQIGQDKLALSIFVFVGYFVVTLFWTENFERAVSNLKYFSYLLLAPVAFSSIKIKTIRYALGAFALGVLFDMVLSYAFYFRWIHSEAVRPDNPRVFMNHLEYSLMLAVFALYSLNNLFFLHWRNRKAWVYLTLFVASTILLFLTHGRSGQLVFILCFPLAVLLRFQGRARWIALAGGMLGVVIIVLFAIRFTSSFEKRFEGAIKSLEKTLNGEYGGSWGKRMLSNKFALEIFSESPVFGKGVGDSTLELEKKLDQNVTIEMKEYMDEFTDYHLHNQYLEYAVQGGIIAIVLFMNLFYQFLRQGAPGQWAANFAYLLSAAYWVGFVAEPFLAKQFSAALFALLFMIFSILMRHQNQAEPIQPDRIL